MTAQEYKKYTGDAYMSKFRTLGAAIAFSLNKHNICKTRIIMLDGEEGIFGVVQNSLAKKFFAAGYEEATYGLEVLS